MVIKSLYIIIKSSPNKKNYSSFYNIEYHTKKLLFTIQDFLLIKLRQKITQSSFTSFLSLRHRILCAIIHVFFPSSVACVRSLYAASLGSSQILLASLLLMNLPATSSVAGLLLLLQASLCKCLMLLLL